MFGDDAMRHPLTALFLATAWACSGGDWSMDPASGLTGDEKKAWVTFFAGVRSLQDEGDRNQAAGFFEQLANGFPQSRYAKDSEELGSLLRQMLEEEKHWVEPAHPDGLSLELKVTTTHITCGM